MDGESVLTEGANEQEIEDLLSAVHFQQATHAQSREHRPSSRPSTRTQEVRIVIVATGSTARKVNPLKQIMHLLEAGQAFDN